MKVTLRPLCEEDAEIAWKWRNDPEVFKYTGAQYDHTITYEDEIAWIRKVRQNADQIRCAIEADGIYVGNIYLTDITSDTAHYHIFIGNKEYWNRGIGRQASILILNKAFYELELKYVLLRVRKENKAAVRLYTSLGFISEAEELDWILMKIKSIEWIERIR